MARGVNKVLLLGNVGNEPEIRATQSGARVARISLATNRSWTDRRTGALQEQTQWHRLVVWGKLVDVIEQWVKKGDKLFIEGRLEYSQVEKDGRTNYYTDIIVEQLTMLGSASGGGGGRGSYRGEAHEEEERLPARAGATPTRSPDDDLPF